MGLTWPRGKLAAWERRALQTLEDLGARWTLQLRLPTHPRVPYPTVRPRTGSVAAQTSAEVIEGMEERGIRPFGVTDAMRSEIATAVRADIRARGLQRLTGAALATLVASHWKRVVIEHRRRGEGVPTPSAAWTERKRRLGLSTQTFIASGQLLADMEAAQIITRRS